MPRLRRRLLDAATLLSLALCVFTAVLWARSYPGELWSKTGHRDVALALLRGTAVLETRTHSTLSRLSSTRPTQARSPNEQDVVRQIALRSSPITSWPTGHTTLGFGWDRRWSWTDNAVGSPGSRDYWISRGTRVVFPLWCPLLLFAALPATRLLAHLRAARRRARAGLCPTCGYDLRATPDRCPECGTTPPPPPAPINSTATRSATSR